MFLRDQSGNWYQVDEKTFKGKKVSPAKVNELAAMERAEAKKRAAEIIAQSDELTLQALRAVLIEKIREFEPGAFECWTAECWTAECWTADCFGVYDRPYLDRYTMGPASRFRRPDVFGPPEGPTYGAPRRGRR